MKRIAGLWMVLAMLAAACGDGGGTGADTSVPPVNDPAPNASTTPEGAPDTTAAPDGPSELSQARARWEASGVQSYSMTVQIGCFCPEEFRGPFEVTVDNGVLTEALYDGAPVRDGVAIEFFTVDGLFDAVADLADSDRLNVTFDPETGIPTIIDADPQLTIADEEVSVTVSDFQPSSDALGRSPLTDALVSLGAAVDSAPEGARTEGGAKMCGYEDVTFNDSAPADQGDPSGRRCFIDAVDAGSAAVFVRSQPTVEGDPVVEIYRANGDGTITVYIDATRDPFGPGAWDSLTCGGVQIRADLAIDYFLIDDCGGD